MATSDTEQPSKASTPDPELPPAEPTATADATPDEPEQSRQSSAEPVSAAPTQTVATTTTADATASAGDWQAVWSPAHNAYYFFNSRTQETTWINPLQPQAESTEALVPAEQNAVASSSSTPAHDPYAAAMAAGIDPELAFLDPNLALPALTPTGPMSYAAKFNARTGAFTKADARTPEHLGEWERARRMSSMYFDVDQWEKEVAARKAQEQEDELNGKKRKRPTKKDLERFKEQKKRKMIAKTAWLRN